MRERATVVALGDGDVWVETRRRGSCGSCNSRTSCSSSLMERLMPGSAHYIRALVEPGQGDALVVGDHVEVQVPDRMVLQASLIVYLLPLGLFMLGMFGGAMLVPGDPGAIVGGLLGLVAGFAVVRLHAAMTRHDRRMQPRVMVDSSVAQGVEAMRVADSIRVVE